MPGSGKTTVGKAIASRLHLSFCDTDDLIVTLTGEKLQDTLNRCGREGFLELERKALLSYEPSGRTVIATGGSAVLHPDAMEHLKSIGTVVFLDADLPLLRKRLWNVESRGIVSGDSDDVIVSVYREREPLYYRYSDIRIHIRGKNVRSIADEILRKADSVDRK